MPRTRPLRQLGMRPQEAVAVEVASISVQHALRSERASGSLGAEHLCARFWQRSGVRSSQRGPNPDAIRSLFERITERLRQHADAADFYQELDQFEQRELADRLISAGATGRARGSCGRTGDTSAMPARGFGQVLRRGSRTAGLDRVVGHISDCQRSVLRPPENAGAARRIYSRCLDDCAAYIRFGHLGAPCCRPCPRLVCVPRGTPRMTDFLSDVSIGATSWQAFERLFSRLLVSEGFGYVTVIGRSGDGGADVLPSKARSGGCSRSSGGPRP